MVVIASHTIHIPLIVGTDVPVLPAPHNVAHCMVVDALAPVVLRSPMLVLPRDHMHSCPTRRWL